MTLVRLLISYRDSLRHVMCVLDFQPKKIWNQSSVSTWLPLMKKLVNGIKIECNIMVILWFFFIMQWVMLFYTVLAGLYGFSRLILNHSITSIIESPFFGIKTVSLKTGALIWSGIIFYLGYLATAFYNWHFLGQYPFMKMW